MVHGNKKETKKQAAIRWRRGKCAELWMSGLNFTQIAEFLKVSNATVTSDFTAIRVDAQERLDNVIERELPTSWLKARMAIQFLQRETLRLYHNAHTENMKLAALQAFGVAQKDEFELVSNSDVLDKCLKHVTNLKEEIKELKIKEVLDIYDSKQNKKEDADIDDAKLSTNTSQFTQDTRAE